MNLKKRGPIILPQFITLADEVGHYMTYDSPDSLICNKTEPDADCTFEVIHSSGEIISLKGSNGKTINLFYASWFRCGGTGGGCGFEVIHNSDNQIYLHSYTNPSAYLTNRQNTEYGGIAASSYAGYDSLFTVSEPIISKDIYDVVYDLPKTVMTNVPPTIALSTTVRNDSRTTEVLQTLTYSYTRSKVGTWNNVAGIEVGAEASFSAGVPFIGSADFKLSVTTSYSHEWGGSEGTDETVTSSTQITVPAGKKAEATVLIKREEIDVSFTYKEEIVYKTGDRKISNKKGVYNNVESYTVNVQVDDWEDI